MGMIIMDAIKRINRGEWIAIGQASSTGKSEVGHAFDPIVGPWVQVSPWSSSPTAGTAIAHGNNYWVLANFDSGGGATDNFAYSLNGINWTKIVTPASTGYCYDLKYLNGYWIAVGAIGSVGYIMTATDPTLAWTLNATIGPFAGSDTPFTVTYGSGYYVAGGYNGKLATATNPTGVWSSRTSGFTIGHIWASGYDGTYFVIGGGQLATAINPAGAWTLNTIPGMSNIQSMAYGNGIWVAVGQNGMIMTAVNPAGAWTLNGASPFSPYAIYGVAYGNGIWVAVGQSGLLATATDPTGIWILRGSSFDTTSPSPLLDIAFGG